MMEHMGHTEDSVETGVGNGQGQIVPERGILFEEPLQAGVQEGIVHLGGMEMDFDFHILEEIHLALLVDDGTDRVFRVQDRQDGFARPFHPDIDVPAHPAFRYRVKPRQAGPFEDASLQVATQQDIAQFIDPLPMQMIHLRDFFRHIAPAVQKVFRRQLMRRQPFDALIADAQQGLDAGHPVHHSPIPRRGILPEGRFAAEGNQEKVSERMHQVIGGRPSRTDVWKAGVSPADDSRPAGRWGWHCGSGSRSRCTDAPRRYGSPRLPGSCGSSRYGVP